MTSLVRRQRERMLINYIAHNFSLLTVVTPPPEMWVCGDMRQLGVLRWCAISHGVILRHGMTGVARGMGKDQFYFCTSASAAAAWKERSSSSWTPVFCFVFGVTRRGACQLMPSVSFFLPANWCPTICKKKRKKFSHVIILLLNSYTQRNLYYWHLRLFVFITRLIVSHLQLWAVHCACFLTLLHWSGLIHVTKMSSVFFAPCA
jgi:hypothetical protein